LIVSAQIKNSETLVGVHGSQIDAPQDRLDKNHYPPPCLITACLLHWRLWGLGTRQINGVNLKSADQVAQKDGRMMDFNRHRKSPN
jgi:ABC-type taurine transport system substrate-binding protein